MRGHRDEEDWEYVILCQGVQNTNRHAKDMKGKMLKIAKNKQDVELVDLIVSNIEAYAHQEDNKHTTAQ